MNYFSDINDVFSIFFEMSPLKKLIRMLPVKLSRLSSFNRRLTQVQANSSFPVNAKCLTRLSLKPVKSFEDLI